MTQGAIFGCPAHNAVPQGLTTDQVFVDVRFTIGHPEPLHVLRSVAQVLTGLGPDLGLSGTSETLLR